MDLESITAHHRAASLAVLCGVVDRCSSIDALKYQLSQPGADHDTQFVVESALQPADSLKNQSVLASVIKQHELALHHVVKGQPDAALAVVDHAVRLIKQLTDRTSSATSEQPNQSPDAAEWLMLLLFNRTLIAGGPNNHTACVKWLTFRKFTLTLKTSEMKTLIETLISRFCALKGISSNSLPYNHATEQVLKPVPRPSSINEADIVLLDLQCLQVWDQSISQSVQLKGAILQLQQYRKQRSQAQASAKLPQPQISTIV